MEAKAGKAWKCAVCGYVHRGAESPAWCPVCGAARSEFEAHAEEAPTAKPAVLKWRCVVCNHVHVGPRPPNECPVCGAASDRFEPAVDEAAAQGAQSAGRVLVVGAGIAGISAVESLRAASPQSEIVLVSREAELPYYRLNLTRYLAGEIGEDDLPIHSETWYEENRVRLVRGVDVSSIVLDTQTVELAGGARERFDRLILTAGAHPFVPPIPGANLEGVLCLRTLVDAQRLLERALAGARCVCIGGGILGLETAGALARRGADVTLLESYGWLLPRQLNRRAGQLLEEHVRHLGIRLVNQAKTEAIRGETHVREVALQGGAVYPADTVVIATGIRPNTYLARQAGIQVAQGILVDDYMTTSHPLVLAAGDVSEHRGILYGIWIASQSQGSIAGLNAAGIPTEFAGIPRSNTLKVLGVDLFSVGKFEPEDASYEVVEQEADGQYCRFVFRDGRMVGGILLGDTALTTQLKSAIESGTDYSGLLRSRPTGRDVLAHLASGQ